MQDNWRQLHRKECCATNAFTNVAHAKDLLYVHGVGLARLSDMWSVNSKVNTAVQLSKQTWNQRQMGDKSKEKPTWNVSEQLQCSIANRQMEGWTLFLQKSFHDGVGLNLSNSCLSNCPLTSCAMCFLIVNSFFPLWFITCLCYILLLLVWKSSYNGRVQKTLQWWSVSKGARVLDFSLSSLFSNVWYVYLSAFVWVKLLDVVPWVQGTEHLFTGSSPE